MLVGLLKRSEREFFGFIPPGVEWELGIFMAIVLVFFPSFLCFVVFWGCFCAFFYFYFSGVRAKFLLGFFFGGGIGKTGNSRFGRGLLK